MYELIEECKNAIKQGKCLGCQELEDKNYKGNPNCIYADKKQEEYKFKTKEGIQIKLC